MEQRDFEHGLLDKAFGHSSSPRNVIEEHDHLIQRNIEYSNLFDAFKKASAKLFQSVDPGKHGEPTSGEILIVVKNYLLNPSARKTAIHAADKMYTIYRELKNGL